MWTYAGRKQRKIWRWLAVERHTRHIVTWVLGARGNNITALMGCHAEGEYHTGTWYFTDQREAYGQVLPTYAHRPSPKGSRQTSLVEAVNGSLR